MLKTDSNTEIFDKVMAYNSGREPERLAMKLALMAKDPFTFMRGSCHLFYEDHHAELNKLASPAAWVCGDLHLENFGSYKGDNGLTYFDLNDFDECALAPCLWEVTRLLTSLIVAAKSLQLSQTQSEKMLNEMLDRYALTLASGKAKWIERKTAKGMVSQLLDSLSKRSQKDFINSRSELKAGKRKLIIDGKRTLKLNKNDKIAALELFKKVMPRTAKSEFYQPLDIARRVAGTGSLGVERYIILVAGDPDEIKPRLIDMKQINASALVPYLSLKQPKWNSQAERVSMIQGRSQAIAPALLKPVSFDNTAYLVKELQPSQDRLDLSLWQGNLTRLDNVFETMAEVVAWSHLRNAGFYNAAKPEALMQFGEHYNNWRDDVLKLAKTAAEINQQHWVAYKNSYAKTQNKIAVTKNI